MTATPMSQATFDNMCQEPSDEVTTTMIKRFHASARKDYMEWSKPPMNGTCVWFLEIPQYVQWLEDQSSSLLWISGSPGCGNTTLATFIIDTISRHTFSDGTNCPTTCFFFDRSSEDRVDGTALLLALMHQLLQADPELTPLVKTHIRLLDPLNLCNIFRTIASELGRKHERIICVVDALDECETASMTTAIGCLASINSVWLKLAVTSHLNKDFSKVFSKFPAYHQIKLTDHAKLMKPDIEKFIHTRCAQVHKATSYPNDILHSIEKELIERSEKRSDNVFLWIDMVLELLQTNTNASPQSFESILRSIPDELEGLYIKIFQRFKADDELSRIISIITASKRVLTLDEFDVALAVRPDDISIRQVLDRCQTDITQHLRSVCGPIIKIWNRKVSFVHPTVTEFLLQPADVARPPSECSPDQFKGCLDVVRVNQCLAQICIRYLNLEDEVSDASLSDHGAAGSIMNFYGRDSDDVDCPTIEKSKVPTFRNSGRGAGLFDYAATYWGTHYRLSNTSTGSCIDRTIFTKAMALCNTSTSNFNDWFQVYWDTISDIPKYPDKLIPLMIASHMGLLDILDHLLADYKRQNKDSKYLRIADSEGWTVLHWAAWNGHGFKNDDAVSRLLKQRCDSSDDSYVQRNEFMKDHQRQPVESSICVSDIQDNKGMTPLHWAADDDQEGIVQLLLDHGATIDIFDNKHLTPLSKAIKSKSLGSVEVLVHNKADINL